jgi:hypothetical protein
LRGVRSFTLTLNVPDEPALSRTVTEAELRFTLNDLIAGDLPEGAELTVGAAPVQAAQLELERSPLEPLFV